MIFDHDLDGSGDIKKTKESVKILEDTCLEQDLIDIWRIRNPTEKRFTWSQKTPITQRRKHFLGEFSLLFLRSSNHQLVDQKKKLYFNNESKASG